MPAGLAWVTGPPGLLLPEATLKSGAAVLETATPALSTAVFSTLYVEKYNCQRSEITRSCSYRSTASPPALSHMCPRSSSSPWPRTLFSQRPWLEYKKRHGWPAQNLLAEDVFKASALAVTRPLGLSDSGLRTSKLITPVHQERASPTAPGQGVKTLLVPMEQDGGTCHSAACRQVCPWLSPHSGVKTHHDNASHPYVPWTAWDKATSLHTTSQHFCEFPQHLRAAMSIPTHVMGPQSAGLAESGGKCDP